MTTLPAPQHDTGDLTEQEPTPVYCLNDNVWSVICLEDGSVMGTNVVLVRLPEDESVLHRMLVDQEFAFEYGMEHGKPIFQLAEDA